MAETWRRLLAKAIKGDQGKRLNHEEHEGHEEKQNAFSMS
jgi:hypothetical protein